jgi:hypothetical protein
VVLSLLRGVTLLTALTASGVRPRILRVSLFIVVAAVVSAGLLSVIDIGVWGEVAGDLVDVLLVAITPVIIAHRITQHPEVTAQSIMAALCIYLLVGLFFSTAYGVIADLESQPFFTGGEPNTSSNLTYFSFITLTTTGYGDLAPATRTGRSIAVIEALIGPAYLVTVVAVLVSNVGKDRPHRGNRSR